MGPSCVFVGALDYPPNVDAASWFCTEAWPAIHTRRPRAKVFLVGRNPAPAVRRLAFAGGQADLERHEVQFDDGGRCDLSEREQQLLHYLACHVGRAVSRDELLARVWGLNPAGITTRTIDMHIARLREKLHDDPGRPRIVLTVRGQGYMLAVPEPR